MALPKRKHSKARRDKRRSANSKVFMQDLAVCTNCKKVRIPHRVCPHCGYYNGKPVVMMKEKKTKKKQ
ncbi:MAG: 50S ribosomal protein L32 [Candidatus Omnitrophota bacterium]|nr:50S ribosomal protein L32 [Candidatus Omnitrophota bacterium]